MKKLAGSRSASRRTSPRVRLFSRAASDRRECRISVRWPRFFGRRSCARRFELIEPTRPVAADCFHRRSWTGCARFRRTFPIARTSSSIWGSGLAHPRSVRDCSASFCRSHDRAARQIPRAGRDRIRADAIQPRCIGSGAFDEALKLILEKHQQIIAIIAPTLREENRAGWSPIMPVCPQCGQLSIRRWYRLSSGARDVEFSCEKSRAARRDAALGASNRCSAARPRSDGRSIGRCDGIALKVDYELYGKDLIDSARLWRSNSSRCSAASLRSDFRSRCSSMRKVTRFRSRSVAA